MRTAVRIVGILDDGWSGLSDAARGALSQAGLVIGAQRTLALVREYVPQAELRAQDGALAEVPVWIASAREAGQTVAVLATGDPLCHGIAALLLGKLGRDGVEILPAPSTLQLAFARWQKPWQDVVITSCHSKDAGEWQVGATPTHGLYPLLRAVALNARVFAFTGPQNDPARIARALITAGYADDTRLSVASRLCLSDEAIFNELAPAEAATQDDRALAVRAVRDAVATLPMRQKEALLLLRFRELSLDDAARVSGRSAGSLKVALHRALATLRRAMLRV